MHLPADVTWWTVVLLGLAIAAGAVTQTVAGFGLAVVGAPFVVIAAPELMPASVIAASLVVPVMELTRGERDVHRQALGWALAGRLLLLPVGVLLVARLSTDAIAVVVGVMVLVGVLGSVWRVDLRATRGTAFGSGVITGISGTAASIGGPFLGLVLQHERPARVRSTLAVFFVVGALTSLVGLGVGGQLDGTDVLVGVLWWPFVLLGIRIAVPLRRRISPDRMRSVILAVAAVAGVTVILRAVLL